MGGEVILSGVACLQHRLFWVMSRVLASLETSLTQEEHLLGNSSILAAGSIVGASISTLDHSAQPAPPCTEGSPTLQTLRAQQSP